MPPKNMHDDEMLDTKKMSEEKTSSHSSELKFTHAMSRMNQQFNLLIILIVAMFVFQGYTYYKLKTVEKKGVAGAPTQAESPLTDDKLVGYAEDIGLEEDKFKSCLESGKMKDKVGKESQEGVALKVLGTPGFFVNGKFFAGAFPFEMFKEVIDKEISGQSSSNCTDYSEGLQQYCKDPANLSFNPESQKIEIGDAPVKGPKNAKVTIVEFSDFECPFCQRAFATVEQILSTYPKDVRLVYKQMPLTSIHPHSQKAAEAALCAKAQGKFWEYHDKVFKTVTEGQQ